MLKYNESKRTLKEDDVQSARCRGVVRGVRVRDTSKQGSRYEGVSKVQLRGNKLYAKNNHC